MSTQSFRKRILRQLPVILLVGLALAAGAALRFSHGNWDSGYQLHPDERGILYITQTIGAGPGATLNPYRTPEGQPRSYAYGSLPLYANAAFAWLLGAPCHIQPDMCARVQHDTFIGRLLNSDHAPSFTHLTYTGRALAALWDVMTLLTAAALTYRLYGGQAAIAAAWWIALAPLHIQNAHYGTVDTAAGFFSTAAVLQMTRFAESPRGRYAVFSGIALGLAVSCKASSVYLVIPALVCLQTPGASRRTLLLLLFAGFASFALSSPYALLDPVSHLSNTVTQLRMVSGSLDWPFTRQYVDTLPVVYPVVQQFKWTFGPLLTVFVYAGILSSSLRTIRHAFHREAVVLAWVWAGVLIVGAQVVKFPRYLLPHAPAMIVLGASLLSPRAANAWRKWINAVLAVLVTLGTALYALALNTVYSQPHPWVEASEWLYANVPAGSILIGELWDDPLPLDLPARQREMTYDSRLIDPFSEPDSPEKLEKLLEDVASADYIILSSDRLYGVILRMPVRYPLTSAYYRALFDGRLGFRLVRTFHRFPAVFNVSLCDDPLSRAGLIRPQQMPPCPGLNIGYLDESLSVYDHPMALVFANRDRFSAEEMAAIIERISSEGSNTK